MPKNSKPTPPQQSNLAEMWGGKKRKPNTNEEGVKEEVTVNGKVDELKADVPVKSRISENLGLCKLWSLILVHS
jgi:DNA ligase-1